MIYYTYAHIRPDTGNIFYVGKGSKKRAYSKYDRNIHWKNTVKKNNGVFHVKILNWFKNEMDAFAAEIWQISQLKAEGNIVNIADGGNQPPMNRMFGDKNPMKNPETALKAKISAEKIRKDPVYRAQISKNRKGKATGEANPMRKPETKGIFSGLNNAMAKYEFREKHYSQNKTKGNKNGMFGKTGAKNPAYAKPSAMRNKKNLGISWVAANKTWQQYWGA